jgi:hypothetical protein
VGFSALATLSKFSLKFSEVSVECQQMFMKYKHPYICCKYPMRKILDRDQENCRSKCKRATDDKECCYLDCIYRETGVIFNGVFQEHAMLRLYENYLETDGAGKYDQWISVIEKNIRKCAETSEKIL